jgi:hypothetical protein
MSSNDENAPKLSIKDKIPEDVKNRLGNYNNNFVIRDAVRQIPHIGYALDSTLAFLGRKIGEQRLLECLVILQEEINLIHEDKVDKDFLTTHEFLDILIKAVENSIKTRHRERIRLNCKILVGAINKDNLNDRHSAEDFLTFVENLTPADIRVGLAIYKLQKNRPAHFGTESRDNTELKFVINSGWDKLQEISGVYGVDFDIAVHKLSAAGLIKEIVGMYGNYTGGLYLITPSFQRLMKSIQLSANDPLFNLRIRD